MNPQNPTTSGHPLRPDEIDFLEYLSIILRRRKTFFIAFLPSFLLLPFTPSP